MIDREAWRGARVLVVGDVMLDRYSTGETNRISPEAPVPVVRVAEEEERPGGAANVAANIVSLGASVTLVGLVGADSDADSLESLCDNCGITTTLIRCDDIKTTVKHRIMSQHQQLLRMDFETISPATSTAPIRDAFDAEIQRCDVVVLSDYGKGALVDSRTMIAAAQKFHKKVVVDPKSNDFSRYAGAHLVTPNYMEFESCVGRCDNLEDVTTRARELCREHQIHAILVTRGDQGMVLIDDADAPLTLAANAQDVFDVTGAGDTVCAVASAALAAGCHLSDAVTYANAAAGIAVGKSGTAAVNLAEIEAVLRVRDPVPAAAESIDEVLQHVSEARAKGEKIVMTNGCFDVIHAGHVSYLQRARAMGSRLIVAVNDDESVRRLKGASRPINPLRDRIAVLSSLSSVDWVIPFSEDTPSDLVERVAPDVLVKGSDYEPTEIAGAEFVTARGGTVATVPLVEGVSSSRIIERLRDEPT